jgi:hypothetical protein
MVALFRVEKAHWDTLNKVQQQHLVRDLTYNSMEEYGEVTKLKGYEVTTEGKINGLRAFPEDEHGNPLPEQVAVRSVAWVVPKKEK